MAEKSKSSKGKLDEEARDSGRRARQAGKSRLDCPFTDYPSKSLRVSWESGWDSVGFTAPTVKYQEPVVVTPGTYLAHGKPFPEAYEKPRPMPCMSCRCIVLHTGKQAVVVASIFDGFAYMWCRGCQHRFKVRVKID